MNRMERLRDCLKAVQKYAEGIEAEKTKVEILRGELKSISEEVSDELLGMIGSLDSALAELDQAVTINVELLKFMH